MSVFFLKLYLGPRRWPGYFPAQTCVRRTRCESATRRRELPQGCGSASGPTRSVSARATRTTRLCRSRKRALPLGAQQCKLDLTTCDQRESGAFAGRGKAMWVATLAMVRVGSQRGTKELQKLQVPWAAPQHMAVARACWADGRPERRPRGVRRACSQPGRVAASPTNARTARRAQKAQNDAQIHARALLVSSRGVKISAERAGRGVDGHAASP